MRPPITILLRSALSIIFTFLFLAALLFLPAGIHWLAGWIFFAVFIAAMLLSTAYLWRVNPDIFVARSKIHRGTKPWDIPILIVTLTSFSAMFPIASFDAKLHWSHVPPWLMIVAYVLFTIGYALVTWVCAVNKFAEPSVRIQSDRQHQLIDTGPYAIIRHPMYAFAFPFVFSIPLALGSFWALIPVATGTIAVVIRTILEDRTLQNELNGYKAYTTRVRYRLIPGIW